MGEVYRARDPRLGRDVAIKALPAEFSRDPERVARFEREARLLASLSHPNIAGIHGLEQVEEKRYLVLEFVEGESLAARLARGALSVEEAIDVCRQIAAGVEAAHEAGVVHRDLKPGNVMLRPDGTVKVLDFGLAKSGPSDRSGSDPNLSASPTITYAATTAGVILGTAAYMSPEQARGRSVDKRSDVWSFGCVLYECLTGHPAFHGETVSDTIASILKTEIDTGALSPKIPARVRELLARCLCKDPRDRLRDIGEARVLLGAATSAEHRAEVTAETPGKSVPLWTAVAVSLALAAVAIVATLLARPRASAGPLRKLDLVAKDIQMDWFFAPQISPDGRQIAYLANGRLWVRDLQQLEPHTAAEVEGLSPLCWSPDSRWLAFNDRKKLWKVPAAGGAPLVMCEVPGTASAIGITWSRTRKLAFSVWRGGVYQVPEGGGTPELMFDIDPRVTVDYHAPSWLPNGDLMYVVHRKGRSDSSGGPPRMLEVFTGGKHVSIAGDFGGPSGSPLVTATGKLLYIRRDANAGIWAVSYDAGKRRVTGEPGMVEAGAVSLSVSEEGSLLFMEGNDKKGPNELVWVDRSGKVVGSVGAVHPGLSNEVLSPDGRRVAFTAIQADNEDVWVRDLARGIDTRITFAEAGETSPQWLEPSRLTYLEANHFEWRILAANADGSGGQMVLAPALGDGKQAAYFAPDRRTAARILDNGGFGRLRLAPVLANDSLGAPVPLLHVQPEPDVDDASIAPNGRLLAYATNDPGQPDVFLTRYPSGTGQWQVSTEGGRRPHWARDSGELFYIGGSGPTRRYMVAVAIDPSQDPPVGTSTRLFDIDPRWLRLGEMPYDVTADGQRFLMAREAIGSEPRSSRMVLVQNWEAEFERKGGP
jgi:serine/threonine-protein kinase